MEEDEGMAGKQRIRIDTGRDQAVEFVRRLSEDDDFREQLAKDPKAVLWEYGVEISPELIPPTVELPPKAELRRMLERSHEGIGPIQPGPQLFFPVFACFFAFPFLTADR